MRQYFQKINLRKQIVGFCEEFESAEKVAAKVIEKQEVYGATKQDGNASYFESQTEIRLKKTLGQLNEQNSPDPEACSGDEKEAAEDL